MAFQPSSGILILIAVLFLAFDSQTFAKPLQGPDLSRCSNVSECCIPPSDEIVDFKPPPTQNHVCMRRAAHLVDEEYKRKFDNATKLMRQLPKEHPWNWERQAALHCAYCDFKLDQVGHPGTKFVVHGSWLFFPFHRAYLYFHERILGKLIGDETFRLPFWNWDSPDGMELPSLYMDPESALYDNTRWPEQKPLNLLNFKPNVTSPQEHIKMNLGSLYRVIVTGGTPEQIFMGGPFRDGDDLEQSVEGTLERYQHATVHRTVGDNMGDILKAGLDPLFYAHHANVDRLWEMWRHLPGRQDFSDPDWLDSAFFFWDENLQLVRIKVRDVLDTKQLGYVYEDVPALWLDAKTIFRRMTTPAFEVQASVSTPDMFPLVLSSSPLRIPLKRNADLFNFFLHEPAEDEVIVIRGIKYDPTQRVAFDVYVSVPSATPTRNTLDLSDTTRTLPMAWAGGFANFASSAASHQQISQELIIELPNLLASIGAEKKNLIVITIVPQMMTTKVDIESIEITNLSKL